jgi:hypothetical protein
MPGNAIFENPLSFQEGYEPGTLFTEFSRDMVYRIRYRWEVYIYAMEGDMSDETKSSNDRRLDKR